MTDTKLTARLPNLDVEMTRSQAPDGQAETITMRMTATPSFDAFGEHLVRHPEAVGALFAGPLQQMVHMNPFLNPAINPMMAWAQMAQAVWAPWLGHASPQALPKPDDKDDPA